jgi:RNA polymerase sigma factor (sigma-70 family)
MVQNTTQNADVHEDIALRLMCGDESVIADILRLPGYAPAIEKVLCGKYRGYLNTEDISDIIADAIWKLWQYRESYDESEGSVRSLLFIIADRCARDVLKHGWQKARQLEKVLVAEEGSDDPLEQIARIDQHLCLVPDEEEEMDVRLTYAVHKALNALRSEYRYVLEADAYAGDDGVSKAELAKRLGVPVGTIGVWRLRAREAFRKELKKLGYDF